MENYALLSLTYGACGVFSVRSTFCLQGQPPAETAVACMRPTEDLALPTSERQ